jgi:hypothetical protein
MAGFTFVGGPWTIKMWRSLPVITNLNYDNSFLGGRGLTLIITKNKN